MTKPWICGDDPRYEPDTCRQTGTIELKNRVMYNSDEEEVRVNLFLAWERTPDGVIVEEARLQFLTDPLGLDKDTALLRDNCIDLFYWEPIEDTRWFRTNEIKIVSEI